MRKETLPLTFDFALYSASPDGQIPLHSQPSWEISVAVSGRGVLTLGDKSDSFTEGDAVLIPPDIPHCRRYDRSSTNEDGMVSDIAIFVNPNWIASLSNAIEPFGKKFEPIIRSNASVIVKGKRAMKISRLSKSLAARDEVFRVLAVVEILLAFTSEPSHRHPVAKSEEDTIKERIEAYLACNHMRKVTLEETARECGMGRTRFCDFMRRSCGRTFVERLNEVRIDEAVKLLKSSTLSVTEISFNVGFSSLAYFNRQFKRIVGKTPREVRKGSRLAAGRG